MSGAAEANCLQPAPPNVESALRANPPGSDAGFYYEEIVRHPAFETEITNRGIFLVSKQGTLIRRQTVPKFEELEIGTDSIQIRRNGKSTERPIPTSFAPLVAALRSIVLGRGDDLERHYKSELQSDENGWTAILAGTARQGETLELSGCGSALESLLFRPRNGQPRLIKFVTQ